MEAAMEITMDESTEEGMEEDLEEVMEESKKKKLFAIDRLALHLVDPLQPEPIYSAREVDLTSTSWLK